VELTRLAGVISACRFGDYKAERKQQAARKVKQDGKLVGAVSAWAGEGVRFQEPQYRHGKGHR